MKFQQKLGESKLDDILSCDDVNEATKLLIDKISVLLDDMAPIKTIQTRSNYVLYLSEETKVLQLLKSMIQNLGGCSGLSGIV